MAKYETCEIKLERIREGQTGNLFRQERPPVCIWSARKMTPSGVGEVIYKSAEFGTWSVPEDLDYFNVEFPEANIVKGKRGNEQLDLEYEKLVASLGNEGWRPTRTNRNGWIVLATKDIVEVGAIDSDENDSQTTNTALLKQLANLRDAGILTQQEFESKKEDILKRI